MAIDYTGNDIPTRNPSTTPADNQPGVLGQDVLQLAAILKEFLPIYKVASDAINGKATSTDITNAINGLQTTINTSLGNKVDKESGKTLYSDTMAANAVSTILTNAITASSLEDRKAANITGTFTSSKISDFDTAAKAAVPTSQLPLESNDFIAEAITDATPLRINKTTELSRIRNAISVPTGGSYDPATGIITISGGGSSIAGLAAFTSPSGKPAGPVADILYLKGANNSETDARNIKSLSGVGVQISEGYTFDNNPAMITQGNGNVTIGGNWYWKIGGSKEWFFHANGYLGVNNSTNTPTSMIDINGSVGYQQLRLRTTYTPTSSSDANGNIGDIAWDTNNIYLKTSAGWKKAVLATV